jgi:hypothetical protein
MPGPKIREEARPGALAGTEEDGVGVPRGLLRQGSDMQPAQGHECAAPPVVVCDLIGASRAGDVGLDRYQIGFVVETQGLDVLVYQLDAPARGKIRGQARQSQRREQRILDGPERRAVGFGQGGEN